MILRAGIVAVLVGLHLSHSAIAMEQVTVGVMDLTSKRGASQNLADVLADLLTTEIGNMGDIEVLGKSDIYAMMEAESRELLSGCPTDSCIAEILGAFNTQYVVTGNLSLFGQTHVLNLKLVDLRSAMVLSRVSRQIKGGDEQLIEELPEIALELFDRVAPRLGIQNPDRISAAAKHHQPISESPAAVIVITRKDIEESGATTITDLLRCYPAMHVYSHDPFYLVAETRGTVQTLMMIDGREVKLEIFPVPMYTALPIGLHDIERIEIVFGPNSALYGPNALAAVINIISRPATSEFQAELSVASGEHGTSIIEGSASGGTGPVAARGSFGIDRANLWMDRGQQAKAIERGSLAVRVDLPGGSLTASGGLTAAQGYTFTEIGYVHFNDALLTHLQLDLEMGQFKARAFWYGLGFSTDLELDIVNPFSGERLARLPTIMFQGDTFALESQYNLELFENNLLIAGADVHLSSHRSDQFVNDDIFEYRFGVFLHDEHQFGDLLVATLGVRLDWNNISESAISPRAAVVLKLGSNHFLRVSGGTAFRKPTILETSANIKVVAEPGFPEIERLFEEKGISNPGLQNEMLTSVELGYQGSLLDKALRLDANLFFGMFRDWTTFATDIRFNEFMQIDFVESKIGFDNTGVDSNIVALNFGAECDPLEELSFFVRGELRYHWAVESGSFIRSPNFLASSGMVLRLPFGLLVHLTGVLVGKRRDNLRDPYSILAATKWYMLPTHTYLLGALTYRLPVGTARLDLGLSFFNPFGAPFREKAGVDTNRGKNYGGELVGTRLMLTARFIY